ncbi:NIL domain-containing protein [Pseudobacteroides cellulosolvens]|uniref:NIL domain-containing protein n=1 Tax=Pseudobacteroides cellulosolvens ATCC 35603 = DSM 2933 TaxID=398512 RepID=A0A0L6JK18_9FIRM|nr:NIL domain-containing protein [Pseudobacteroides cellulosolvens]KNY26063.1 NIL domain-containing protein [Pseudobacteroides cellulosolvens ATCC 35603 = DSM 2933]
MKKIKVSLIYPAGDVGKPITYHLVKDFNLVINILHADINLNKMGKLVLDIEGEEEDIENGLKFVEEQGIKYKLFTKTIIWQEDDCIHCGACTAVCPSNALSMDKADWSLTFDKEKCLVCELCVKSCPLNVMCVSI